MVAFWGSTGRISWCKFTGDPEDGCALTARYGMLAYMYLYDGCPPTVEDKDYNYGDSECFDHETCDKCETAGNTSLSMLTGCIVCSGVCLFIVQARKNASQSHTDSGCGTRLTSTIALGIVCCLSLIALSTWYNECFIPIQTFLVDKSYNGTITVEMGAVMVFLVILFSGFSCANELTIHQQRTR
eukprot:CAMPEP_0167825432 /NCGR_PEP_ID=MMETSP0112_2-20121227/9367_1 /TAXON_ID=91324 /ORGANISM="Lotharella globosa, Strain CCCM811" /LENGTH=184 /DNA_ID=CAMNT_0007727547 /DNA_START=1 /DNA_END=555 /DNA_ORIENTATION=-